MYFQTESNQTGPRLGGQTMGEKGKEYCLKNHDYTILADSFLEVLKFDKKIIDTE